MDFILGTAFLERFLVAFDDTDSTIGFATTPYTDVVVNSARDRDD